jgi:queuine tRNA-ribosyltransferase
LKDRVLEEVESELVVWDVGLGAATNAMSLISHYEDIALENKDRPIRPLHVISFENDLDSLRLAIQNHHHFSYLKHPGPFHILDTSSWKSKSLPIRWTLVHGDFLENYSNSQVPDLIFYDPFSYKTDSNLWTLECFEKIYQFCQGHSTELFTYSSSTAVRAALFGAGFYVAQGVGTGPKAETTIALTRGSDLSLSSIFLGSAWVEKWNRSGSRYPAGLTLEQQAELSRRILAHPQLVAN